MLWKMELYQRESFSPGQERTQKTSMEKESTENLLTPEEHQTASWTYENRQRAGASTHHFPRAKCLYLAIRGGNNVYGVIGIPLQKETLDSFEYSILLSVINECALAMENAQNAMEKEKNAVIESDFVVVLLPGGKGTHIELGIALGQGKRIFIYSPGGEVNNFDTTSTFYHLPEIEKCFGTIDKLVDSINSKLTGALVVEER